MYYEMINFVNLIQYQKKKVIKDKVNDEWLQYDGIYK